MNGPRCRRLRRLIGLVLLAPPLLWLLIVLFGPTDWARRLVERRIAEKTQCPVRIADLRLGLLGGVRIHGLEVFDPIADDPDSAWLRARKVKVGLGPLGLVRGDLAATEVMVDGLYLRLGRRLDGSFVLGHLIRSNSGSTENDGRARVDQDQDSTTRLTLRHGVVQVQDLPSGTRLKLTGLEGEATLRGDQFDLERLDGLMNGGTVSLAAEVATGDLPGFQAKMRADRVRIGREARFLDYIFPFLSGVPMGELGLLDAELELQASGRTYPVLKNSLRGRGRAHFDPVALDRSLLAEQVTHLVPVSGEVRLGSLQSEFLVRDARFHATMLRLVLGACQLTLTGSTSFDGQMNYRIDSDELTGQVAEHVPDLLRRLPLDSNGLMRIEVQGSVDAPVLSVNGQPLVSAKEGENPLREISRMLKQTFLR